MCLFKQRQVEQKKTANTITHGSCLPWYLFCHSANTHQKINDISQDTKNEINGRDKKENKKHAKNHASRNETENNYKTPHDMVIKICMKKKRKLYTK